MAGIIVWRAHAEKFIERLTRHQHTEPPRVFGRLQSLTGFKMNSQAAYPTTVYKKIKCSANRSTIPYRMVNLAHNWRTNEIAAVSTAGVRHQLQISQHAWWSIKVAYRGKPCCYEGHFPLQRAQERLQLGKVRQQSSQQKRTGAGYRPHP